MNEKTKTNTNFRMWKSGKHWLFASATVLSVAGAGVAVSQGVDFSNVLTALSETAWAIGRLFLCSKFL